jgi:filamentous hemagglutinin family protein
MKLRRKAKSVKPVRSQGMRLRTPRQPAIHSFSLKPLARYIRQATLPAGLILGLQPAFVMAGPQGGDVVAGQGNITRPDVNSTYINQASQNIAIDWRSFDIAKHELVQFNQPSKTAHALNRIYDQKPSEIFGTLRANGNVTLVNPRGLFFGPSANVDVNSLTASGLDIRTEDFMAGQYSFEAPEGEEGGMVVNQGLLAAATGGSINLVGGAVRNEGVIYARAGQVNLAAGNKITMDFDGDGLVQFTVDKEVLQNAHALDQ